MHHSADCVDPIQESAGVGGWKKVEVIDDLYKGKQGYVSNECKTKNTKKKILNFSPNFYFFI